MEWTPMVYRVRQQEEKRDVSLVHSSLRTLHESISAD